MANGDPNFEFVELPVLERFYAPIAATLENFAVRHHLQLEKYYKRSSNWHFDFRHRAGGTGSIQVMPFSEDSLLIAGSWSVADFDAFTRRTWSAEHRVIARDAAALAGTLTQSLHEMLARQLPDTKSDGVDYRQIWRAEFISLMRESELRLPVPIP